MQTSYNGGELLNANVEQDTNHSPQINPNNAQPIMPSSKSISPTFDLEKYQKARMSSSKSMTHPIEFKLEVEDVKDHYTQPAKSARTINLKKYEEQLGEEKLRLSSSKSLIITDFQPFVNKWFSVNGPEGIKVQPELIPKDSSKSTVQSDLNPENNKFRTYYDSKKPQEKNDQELIELKGAVRFAETSTRFVHISWSAIGLGVLGILFVVIGSIIYFKRKSN